MTHLRITACSFKTSCYCNYASVCRLIIKKKNTQIWNCVMLRDSYQNMDRIVKQKNPVCVIFGFCRGVNDVLALLGCYAAMTGSYLPTFRDSLSVHTIPYTTTHPTAPGPLLVLLYRCRWDAEVVPKRPKISINPAQHIRRGKDFKIRVR